MKYIKVEKDIWKLKDGSLWEGNVNECPESNPSDGAVTSPGTTSRGASE